MIMVITVTLLAAYALTTLVIYRQNVDLGAGDAAGSGLYCKGNRDIRDRLLKADGRGRKEYKNYLD